jgi:hypothetical protein
MHNLILIVSLALGIVGVAACAKSRVFGMIAVLAMCVFALALSHVI